ncbi:hypothetical protein C8J56DRAFT_763169, partial [Mycena floridula]
LAFVEWFTAFTTPHEYSGLYRVRPLTQNHQRRCSIIPVSQILHSCHLIPDF